LRGAKQKSSFALHQPVIGVGARNSQGHVQKGDRRKRIITRLSINEISATTGDGVCEEFIVSITTIQGIVIGKHPKKIITTSAIDDIFAAKYHSEKIVSRTNVQGVVTTVLRMQLVITLATIQGAEPS
jgi:hypothetical protein